MKYYCHFPPSTTGFHKLCYIRPIKNNKLLRRFSLCDVKLESLDKLIHTKLYPELGWGHYFDKISWEVEVEQKMESLQ